VRLPDDEVRRLVAYLRSRVSPEELTEIGDILRSEEGTDYVRRRALLQHFPPIEVTLSISGIQWLVHITTHAHLRLVQRGIAVDAVQKIFVNFVDLYSRMGELIIEGNYALVGRTRRGITTIQIDIEQVTDREGETNVVSVYLGRPGEDEDATTIELV
jgi:hypothetical protein